MSEHEKKKKRGKKDKNLSVRHLRILSYEPVLFFFFLIMNKKILFFSQRKGQKKNLFIGVHPPFFCLSQQISEKIIILFSEKLNESYSLFFFLSLFISFLSYRW